MEAVETVQETQRQLVDTAADVQKVAHKADKLVNHIQEQMDALRGFAVPPTDDVQTWEGLLSRAEDFIICISGITSARSIPSLI
jgi:ABC-type transporter Mla subunit MlaD